MPRQRRYSDNVNLMSVFSPAVSREEQIDVEDYGQGRSPIMETKKRKAGSLCVPSDSPTMSSPIDVDSMGPVGSNVRVVTSNRPYSNAYPVQRPPPVQRASAGFVHASPIIKDSPQSHRGAIGHVPRNIQNGVQYPDMDPARRPLRRRAVAHCQDTDTAGSSSVSGGYTQHFSPVDRFKDLEEEDLDVVNPEDIFTITGQTFFNAESFLRAVSSSVYSTEEFEEALEQLVGREPPAADMMDVVSAYRTLRTQNTLYANVIKTLLGHTMTLNARVTLLEAEDARAQENFAVLRQKVDELSQFSVQRLYKDTMFDVSRLNALVSFVIEAEHPLRSVDAVTVFADFRKSSNKKETVDDLLTKAVRKLLNAMIPMEHRKTVTYVDERSSQRNYACITQETMSRMEEVMCILFGIERMPMSIEEQQLRDDFVRKFVKDVKKELGIFRRKRRMNEGAEGDVKDSF